MNFWTSVRREMRPNLTLSLPLIAGQLNHMLVGLADTLMIGQLGTVPLAAAAFSNTILYLPMMVGIGMAMAVSVLVSQARGAKEPATARAALRHGLFVSLFLGIGIMALGWITQPLWFLFRQDEAVVEAAPAYFHLVAASLLPMIAATSVKSHSDAMNRPWPAFWVMSGGVLLNIVLNWLLIYGNLGAPQLGLEGAGLATLLARMTTLVGMIMLCCQLPSFQEWVPRRWFRKPDWTAVRELLGIGWPMSIQMLAETGAFVIGTMVVGSLGAAALASHQVAIQCAAAVFMVPLGISQALTVRIGEAVGANDRTRFRPIAVSGWFLVILCMSVSATSFLLYHRAIASAFLSEPDTLATAAGLLLIAAAFQLGDGLQIASAGALRGLSDVAIPAALVICVYWGVALPLGWWLTHPVGMGAAGMWWGFTVGLSLTALVLSVRLWRKTGPSDQLTN
ncbi:MAG: MATE family efflux transporter [Verrucomicrobiota bacterium]